MSESAAAARASHRGIITVCLMIATLMQALDTTIANVALPYMQGSLSASYDEATWILTSYVIAAAIFTAPIGWLAARFGRKQLFVTCLIGFTITSMACGLSTSLTEMVLDRFLQGMFGAALVPLSQTTIMDIYPPEQRGMAMAVWGMGVMVGPILGPTLGGFLTADYNWRFVFFVNLPFGILAVLGLMIFMPRAEVSKSLRFDWTGFVILSLALASLQIVLDRGEDLDWLSSPTIIACLVVATLGFYLFVVHLVMAKNPFIQRVVFKDRNFSASLVMMFSVGIMLVASSSLMTPFLENLGNYPVAEAGLIMSPRGIGTMGAMLVVGRLLNRVDPRALMFVGFLLLGSSMILMEGWTPDVSVGTMAITIIIQGAGLGFVFVPLQVAAFYTLGPALRTQGAALMNLMRNVGAAIGIAVTSALLDHQAQYEHAVLSQYVTPFTRTLPGGLAGQQLNPTMPGGAALMNSLIDRQAQIIGYIDDYKFMLFSLIPAVVCLFFLRTAPRSAAAAGGQESDSALSAPGGSDRLPEPAE